jgi:hypothetical protein
MRECGTEVLDCDGGSPIFSAGIATMLLPHPRGSLNSFDFFLHDHYRYSVF